MMPLINRPPSHLFFAPPASLCEDKLPLLSETLDELLRSITSGCKPTSVLRQLYSLKAFVQQKETDKLEKALEELHNTSLMSAGQSHHEMSHQTKMMGSLLFLNAAPL